MKIENLLGGSNENSRSCACCSRACFRPRKEIFLTERSGVRTMQRLSPAKVFWQEKFPANEITGVCLVLGFFLLLLP